MYFLSTHDHIKPKANLNKYQRIGIKSNMFSQNNAIKLGVNNKKIDLNIPYIWMLKNILISNSYLKEESELKLNEYSE